MTEVIEPVREKNRMAKMKVAHVCRKCDRIFSHEYTELIEHSVFEKLHAADPDHYYMNGASSDNLEEIPYRRTIDNKTCGFC